MAKFSQIESLKFEKPATWPEWKQRFSRYRLATKLHKEDEEIQVSALIYSMGPEAETALKSFTFAEEGDCNKYDIVLSKFDQYFEPKRNIIHERAMFHQRNQLASESVETYVRHLFELAERCDFGDKKNDHIRDRIVIGVLDKELSKNLQMREKLTMEKAIECARHAENVKLNLAQQATNNNHSVDRVLSDRRQGNKPSNQNKTRPRKFDCESPATKPLQQTCTRCGYTHRSSHQDSCPALGAT